jgi:hypothetical protein
MLKNCNLTSRNSITLVTFYAYKDEGTRYILNHNKIGIAVNLHVMNIYDVFIMLRPLHSFARLTHDVEFGGSKNYSKIQDSKLLGLSFLTTSHSWSQGHGKIFCQ